MCIKGFKASTPAYMGTDTPSLVSWMIPWQQFAQFESFQVADARLVKQTAANKVGIISPKEKMTAP